MTMLARLTCKSAVGRLATWYVRAAVRIVSYRFSVLVNAIFENTNIGLRQWFKVIYLMLTSKNGISSLQIQRMMGFGSYKTALYISHRIRTPMADPEFCKLIGIVEVVRSSSFNSCTVAW